MSRSYVLGNVHAISGCYIISLANFLRVQNRSSVHIDILITERTVLQTKVRPVPVDDIKAFDIKHAKRNFSDVSNLAVQKLFQLAGRDYHIPVW